MHNHKSFFKFVIPSVLSFALSGVYTIVDGLFVGNSIGDIGLGAINIAYPIVALIQALGTGIGLAGAIQYTIFKAQDKSEEEKSYFGATILLLVTTGIALTGLFLLLADPMLRLLGASGDTLFLANEYIHVIVIGAIFQVMGTGLVPFVRNMGGATFAMVAMIAGFLANVSLDYLFIFIFNWGIAGAAWATVIGQGVTMLATILFLLRKRPQFSIPPLKKTVGIFGAVLKMSFAPFGLTFSPNITLILMNRFLLAYGGTKAIATYACIAYITTIVYMLLQGIGDGSQPLISRFFGQNNLPDLKQTRRLAYLTGGAIGVTCIAVLFFSRNLVGMMFGASAEVNQDVALILPLFLCSIPFLSFVRITTPYFYATKESKSSYLLVYAEPLLLFVLLLILPPLTGVWGVWLAVPLSQVITCVLAVFTKHRVDLRTTCPA